LRARARLEPDLLAHAATSVRRRFQHDWAPVQALAKELSPLPSRLAEFLLDLGSGFALITAGESGYQPGPLRLRRQGVVNVAFVSVTDLADGNERPLHVLGHLIDHHLGCLGEATGAWLSEGGGVSPDWQAASARLGRLFQLGYGVDAVAQSHVRDYFAQSVAAYCRDRRLLNVSDPQMCKWLRATLWDAAFWKAPVA
jgi:hypothetical protein